MRRLWHQRPSRGRAGSRLAIMPSSRPEAHAPTPGEWEAALGGLVIGAPNGTPLERDLSSDPGVAVLRRLVGSVRAGMTVDTLRLTCRLLMLKLGDQGFQDLLQDFWKSAPPEQFASEEARNFAAFLKSHPPGVEHAGEVLDYELANHQACIEGTAGTVPFTCEPTALLTALGQGRLPPAVEPGQFEVQVEPPAQISNR